eukprot:UN33832
MKIAEEYLDLYKTYEGKDIFVAGGSCVWVLRAALATIFHDDPVQMQFSDVDVYHFHKDKKKTEVTVEMKNITSRYLYAPTRLCKIIIGF